MSQLQIAGVYRLVIRSDQDLLESLLAWAKENQVTAARFKGSGMLKSATLGFFHQVEKELTTLRVNKPVELINLTGDISEKSGLTEVTGKITIADPEHKVMGGGLVKGNKAFSVEVFIDVFENGSLKRVFESQTGLSTWAE